jgi:hypothetical protein
MWIYDGAPEGVAKAVPNGEDRRGYVMVLVQESGAVELVGTRAPRYQLRQRQVEGMSIVRVLITELTPLYLWFSPGFNFHGVDQVAAELGPELADFEKLSRASANDHRRPRFPARNKRSGPLEDLQRSDYGRAALHKLGPVPANFRLYFSKWLDVGEDNVWKTLLKGREFRYSRNGALEVPVPGTIRSVVVSHEEMLEMRQMRKRRRWRTAMCRV